LVTLGQGLYILYGFWLSVFIASAALLAVHTCRRLSATFLADTATYYVGDTKIFCQSPANHYVPSGRVLELFQPNFSGIEHFIEYSRTRRNRKLIISKQHCCNQSGIRMGRASAPLLTLALWNFFAANYICT